MPNARSQIRMAELLIAGKRSEKPRRKFRNL
jgi:hypothetical protein